MQIRTAAILFGVAAGFTGGVPAALAQGERVEIPVKAALAPVNGYDDNDNVEAVLYGYLPNACYTLADSYVEHDADGLTIGLHQYAIRSTEGFCAEGATLPPHLTMTIPFTRDVFIGRLPAAGYRLRFLGEGGTPGLRALNVSNAVVPTIDSLPYAAVSTAGIADVAGPNDELEVTLTGVLNSTCTTLNPEVQVRKEDNVFILLPTIQVRHGVICAQVLTPFERKVKLGKAGAPGSYLVHVRSMSGKSVNHVVEIVSVRH